MKNSKQHTIDLLFSIALFFVFSATALVILLLSSNIYTKVVNDSENNFQTGTSISYITEKIRHNDEGGSNRIFLSEFDNHPALAITQQYNENNFVTYIYEYNGELKESFVQEGVAASASSGTTIMKINSLDITQVSDDLLRITCTPEFGDSASVLINIHSDTH